MYIQPCIITALSQSPLLFSWRKKKVFRIAHSYHLFQVRRVISYYKSFVANDYVIYFTGRYRDIEKWGTPEGKVILNTSSCLTLAVFVEQMPSTPTASWIIYCIVSRTYFNKSAKAPFAIWFKKNKKKY